MRICAGIVDVARVLITAIIIIIPAVAGEIRVQATRMGATRAVIANGSAALAANQ